MMLTGLKKEKGVHLRVTRFRIDRLWLPLGLFVVVLHFSNI